MRHGTKGEHFAVRCNVERKPWYIASDSQNITPRQCLQYSSATDKLFWVSGEDQSGDPTHLRKATSAGVVASMNLAVFYLGISQNPATPELLPHTPRATEGLQFGRVSLAGAANQDSRNDHVDMLAAIISARSAIGSYTISVAPYIATTEPRYIK